MRKKFAYFFVAFILLIVTFSSLDAQEVNLVRWVFGTGGWIEANNSDNLKMSGISGQFAIETIKGTFEGKNLDVHQGFWVLESNPVGVDWPVTPNSDRQIANYPNPFSSSTEIRYELPDIAYVTLKIYDVVGNNVKTLVDGYQNAGSKSVLWDGKDFNGTDLGSGSYMYELNVRPAQMAGSATFQAYTLRNIMVLVR